MRPDLKNGRYVQKRRAQGEKWYSGAERAVEGGRAKERVN